MSWIFTRLRHYLDRVLFFVLSLGRRLRRPFDRAVLSVVTFGVVTLISLKAFFSRQRMSHDNGIVGRGRLHVVDDPAFPAHDLFRPGREFPCKLRHGSASYHDDAMLVVRSGSLKLIGPDGHSSLDLLMNTGDAVAFNNALSFVMFMWVTIRGRSERASRWMFNKYPRLWVGLQGLNRRNPDSYAHCYYQSKSPLEYIARDGRKRYCKFQLLPSDKRRESGLPDELDRQTPWNQNVLPGEKLGPTYLKDEYRERVAKGPVSYLLQIQIHDWKDSDTRDVFDSARPWNPDDHRWLDLARVEIDETLSDEDGNPVTFSLANLPETLRVIPALSIFDPPSLDHLRLKGIWARRARRLGTDRFGMPKPIPDQRGPLPQPPRGQTLAPSLPQRDDAERQEQRRNELAGRGKLYKWQHDPRQPPFARELPPGEQFRTDHRDRMLWNLEGTLLDLALWKIARTGEEPHCLNEFGSYYVIFKKPTVAWRFHRDDEFARQRLAGVNPVLIERCDEIPDNFPVKDKDVAGLLGEGESLEQLRDEGRLYLLDYHLLEGIPVYPGRYLAVPLVLFQVNNANKLMPLAIQLGQSPDAGPIFTPNDPPWLWLTVKTFVQSADAHYHEVASHLLRTHMITETFAVATARKLDSRHPVYALLRPHFQGTLAINRAARSSMLAPGGAIDRVLASGADGALDICSRAWAEWRFDRVNLRNDLRERGVDDTERLPDYPYRDDALRLWDCIENFVRDVLGHYYQTDNDVYEDKELQGWAEELVDEKGGRLRGRGLPGDGSLDTREQLFQIVAQAAFTASAEHASVNNGQWDMFGYVPNVPGALYAPPPKEKNELSQRILVDMLPRGRHAVEQIAMVRLLSTVAVNTLGGYPPVDFFGGEPYVSKRLLAFRDQLAGISSFIRERNLSLEVPYTYLDPAQIGQSINI